MKSATLRVRRALGQPIPEEIMRELTVSADAAAEMAKDYNGQIAKLFFANRGAVVHKWIHYLPIYERYFAKFRNSPVKMLEIGVSKGGSLQMWREYFGPDATIFGIDIDPECAGVATPPNQVRIGSQDDPDFLRSVISEMGAPDIILDDGSHVGRHQRASFDTLFPLLKPGGIYAIEDLHTAYWPEGFEGGHRRRGTAVEHIKEMIDDLHAWYHKSPTTTPAKTEIGGIHIYDSIVVIEKQMKSRPGHTLIGSATATAAVAHKPPRDNERFERYAEAQKRAILPFYERVWAARKSGRPFGASPPD